MARAQSDGTADAVYWQGRGDAMQAALKLGADYGRPIVTGIGVAEDETSWFIRVDFHGMVLGDSHLIVRNPLDMRAVAVEYHRISESNQAEIIADRERMNAAYEAAQKEKEGDVE